MAMIEINNTTGNKINLALIRKTVKKFLELCGRNKFTVSIALVGDGRIRALNKQYRQLDKTTDVLAFSGEDNFLGEIIINYQQVKRQAGKFNQSVQRELLFILVHGLLHLLGYDDETEKGRREMESLGENYLKRLQIIK